MSLRYLLDEGISPGVAESLRRQGNDAVSVFDVQRANLGIPDEAQLEYAAAHGRVCSSPTTEQIFRPWIQSGTGVAARTQASYGQASAAYAAARSVT